ncbi:MAG: hypothetical protein ABJP45_04825 [Cyclobacteriaceae bacterium]
MKRGKRVFILLVTILSIGVSAAQETKTLTGRIISEDLEILPKAMIYDMDTTLLGSTDLDGYFKLDIPVQANELLLGYVGMEWTSVKIQQSCEKLEMVIMYAVTYDFTTAKKIKKKRYKRFKQLPKKHSEAYELGIFTTSSPCVNYVFSEY